MSFFIYATGEVIVAVVATFGNLLVVYVFCTSSRLRSFRNYYIFALSVADFLIGTVGIPVAIVAEFRPETGLHGCLLLYSVVIVLCVISILCLVAVSVDRFWATFNPLNYYKNMSGRIVGGILSACVTTGLVIGLLPLFGWHNEWTGPQCTFAVVDPDFLVFVYFAAIIFPALLMAGFYGYIYRFIQTRTKKKQQAMNPTPNHESKNTEKSQRKEAKAGKKLSSIILFFLICWMPLNTINCVLRFCGPACFPGQEVMEFTIVLSHANSAINPFLYAYHLKEFRLAMRNVLCSIFTVMSFGRFQSAPVPISSQSQSGL